MKKIGIIANINEEAGGIYQYTLSLLETLITDKDNQYILFTYKNNNKFDNIPIQIKKFDIPELNIFKKIIKLFCLLFNIRKPFFFSKEEINLFSDIDIFISPYINLYPHYYLNKPYIFTLHDLQEYYLPSYFSFKEKIKRYILNKICSKNCKYIICESNYVKNDIIKFFKINNEKIKVIPSPPSKAFLNYNFDNNYLETVKKKYNLPEKYLFYPANFWYHKNHLNLIEAFYLLSKKYRDLYLVLSGNKKNNYNNVLKKIDSYNLQEKIKILGFVDYQDLPAIYKLSIMLVMPSFFESISIPNYEAFSLKVPVCSSNAVGLKEQVQDCGLLFDPYDIEDIKNKIEILLDNKELRNQYAIKGYNKIKQFSLEDNKKNIVELY